MSRGRSRVGDNCSAIYTAPSDTQMGRGVVSGVRLGGYFTMRYFEGKVVGGHYRGRRTKWETRSEHNLVVNVGLDYMAKLLFNVGGLSLATPVVGLIGTLTTIAAGDTMASHAGWTEDTTYTGNRKTYTGVADGDGEVTNAASVASFSINGTSTIRGAFLNTAATGTGGVLICAAALSGGNQAVSSGGTLEVTYAWTSADDGV